MLVWSLGRADFPGDGNSNPLQYPRLGNPMDREVWRVTVHGDAKSQTRLSTHRRSRKIIAKQTCQLRRAVQQLPSFLPANTKELSFSLGKCVYLGVCRKKSRKSVSQSFTFVATEYSLIENIFVEKQSLCSFYLLSHLVSFSFALLLLWSLNQALKMTFYFVF